MNAATFVTSVALRTNSSSVSAPALSPRFTTIFRTSAPPLNRNVIYAAKKKGGGKRPTSRQSKNKKPSPIKESSSEPSSSASPSIPTTDPITSESIPSDIGKTSAETETDEAGQEDQEKPQIDMQQILEDVSDDVSEEEKISLPEMNVTPGGIKRKRKPRSLESKATQMAFKKLTRKEKEKLQQQQQLGEINSENNSSMSLDKIKELTTAYRLGEEGRQELIDELEKDPDFILKAAGNSKEYDLTSAIFGTGKPNKQGIYILPYLQSAHIVLLAIALLVAFIYYPGFPLTESDDSVRQTFKITLVIVFSLNSILSILAFQSAKKRSQPPSFWALKTFVLGELAFGELRRNTQIVDKK